MRDILPNGLLGLAIAGLLAAFMAGMAANISAFNTVFSYDLWQRYIRKDHSDDYYLRIGRLATVGATFLAIFTAIVASSFSNVMDYLQTLFGFFNAPLFATFILGMFWKRMTATAGWVGLTAGTLSAVLVAFLSEDAFGEASLGVIPLSGQGAAFVAASAAFVVDIGLSVIVRLYGIILTLMGLFGDKAYEKTGGVNANLWTGLILLVMSAGFMTWARLRPIIVPAHVEPPDDDPTRPAPRRRPSGH